MQEYAKIRVEENIGIGENLVPIHDQIKKCNIANTKSEEFLNTTKTDYVRLHQEPKESDAKSPSLNK